MTLNNNETLADLMNQFPVSGKIVWIGIRREKFIPLDSVDQVMALENSRLEGDHFHGRKGSKRQVTLIQKEHIDAVANMMNMDEIDPSLLRRNIVVEGINLLALKNKKFQIGEAILEMTGLCHPCSRMEQNLGSGGYNAMRGHGGITARIVKGGLVCLKGSVIVLDNE